MEKIKTILSRLSKSQIVIILVIAASVITGGILLYREWEARQPMDFTLPEPVPSVDATATPQATQSTPPTGSPGSPPTPVATPSDAETSHSASSTPKPTGAAQGGNKPLVLKEDEIGRLVIEGKKIAIKRGVSESVLKKHVGWMETSVMPGDSGVCVLMGHRDQDLKQLKKVKIGSVITVDTPQGSFAYTVYALDILDKDTPAQIPAAEGGELMLLTCFPFYYSGSAPQQLVVRGAMLQ